MNIEQAIDIVYTGFIGKDSVPDQLKSSRKLDLEKLGQVREALDVVEKYYEDTPFVPKKIAMAMVDLQGAFFFKHGFEEEMLRKLEDIGMEFQEKALKIFSE